LPSARRTTEARARESEWLEIGLGAQILKDLGISSIRLLASRERHYVGLEGFGIAITQTEICHDGEPRP
jgi:3,4-dihydroxy 2-butanone 4-phosphate synthase/GTP cyclohydrolase II